VSPRRSRAVLFAASALALSALAVPTTAPAAKVTETAPGGLVPSAFFTSPTTFVSGSLTQEYVLKGRKVKGRQVLDVNLTLNTTGSGPAALEGHFFVLYGPSGNSAAIPVPGLGQSLTNLKFDDQSILRACIPFSRVASNCNYQVGGTPTSADGGSWTGTLDAASGEAPGFNRVFAGDSAKGTWTLLALDFIPATPAPTTTLGVSTLEVKTGKRFEKD
jgi:hypothetical protein